MGRHVKLKPPGPGARAERTAQDASQDEAGRLINRASKHLDELLDACERTLLDGEASPGLARESAGVARAIVSLSSELRQRERGVRDAVRSLAPEERDALVREYVKDLPAKRRAEFRAWLNALDDAEKFTP